MHLPNSWLHWRPRDYLGAVRPAASCPAEPGREPGRTWWIDPDLGLRLPHSPCSCVPVLVTSTSLFFCFRPPHHLGIRLLSLWWVWIHNYYLSFSFGPYYCSLHIRVSILHFPLSTCLPLVMLLTGHWPCSLISLCSSSRGRSYQMNALFQNVPLTAFLPVVSSWPFLLMAHQSERPAALQICPLPGSHPWLPWPPNVATSVTLKIRILHLLTTWWLRGSACLTQSSLQDQLPKDTGAKCQMQ